MKFWENVLRELQRASLKELRVAIDRERVVYKWVSKNLALRAGADKN